MSSPETDARRLGKFMARSGRVLETNAVALLGDDVKRIQIVAVDPTDPSRGVTLKRATLDVPQLHLSILDLRPFFLVKEDCYLPKVAEALRNSLPKHKRKVADHIIAELTKIIDNGVLKGALMTSGRLESDNGVGMSRLQSSDQVTMDYIYGLLMHEEEPRRARLNKLGDLDTIRYMVLIQLAQLVFAIRNVRETIEECQETGDLGPLPDTLTVFDTDQERSA